MDVTIDQDSCIAAGQCVLAAPDVFDQREEDGVAVLRQNPSADQHGATREAAVLCPAGAIELDE
ncbi:ferredoxin [Kribbella italica]|uniref:Ferredoxin n=1 Tax=Kribbella italica TaxID=1540520 RepID=A0A7W9JGD9_9ACTN|nr:ferredoxin [Kribbella italica]MBB5841613.1 ferredoxin [Kribbella italica]